MDEKNGLWGKRNLENIVRITFITSYLGQIASYLGQQATSSSIHTPSIVEQYLNNPTGDLVGALLTVGGAGYSLYSMATSHGFYKKEGLVTDGSHRIVRHPIYLGFRLSSIGMMIANPSSENLIAGTIVFMATEILARMEDKKLLGLYSDESREYQSNVPMWIPYSNNIKSRFKRVGSYIANTFRNPTPF